MRVKAYIAEVDTPEGTKFVGLTGALKRAPHFWQTKPGLLRVLNPNSSYQSRYNPERDELKTQVIQIENLNEGLRSAAATRMSVLAFKTVALSKSKALKEHPNNIYKIRLGDGPATKVKKKYFGASKVGKSWMKAGHLRNFISNVGQRWSNDFWMTSSVVIVQLGQDLISPVEIKTVSLIDFYCQSEICKERYLGKFAPRFTKFGI